MHDGSEKSISEDRDERTLLLYRLHYLSIHETVGYAPRFNHPIYIMISKSH